MKYWNKRHEVQRRCWHRVIMQNTFSNDAKVWCQQQASTGKFFGHVWSREVYFERDEDATFFLLKWG